jgi:hypothetical protein
MDNNTTREIVAQIASTIDIPESAYGKAEKRYKDLADWFGRPECQCAKYDPHIYPQGSFRLGTVVRPLNEDDRYDLDFGCRLAEDITATKGARLEDQYQLPPILGDLYKRVPPRNAKPEK